MKNKFFDIVELIALTGGIWIAIDSLGEPKRLRKAELIGQMKGIAIAHLDDCTNEDQKLAYMEGMVDAIKEKNEEELSKEHKLRERRIVRVAKKLNMELSFISCKISVTKMMYMLANKKASDETEDQFIESKNRKMMKVIEDVDECITLYTENILPLYGEYLSLIK